MSANAIGKIFTLTTFGESHGNAIGGVIDGCPAGLKLDLGFIQDELARRKPGQSAITTQRKEEDLVEFLSGTMNNITTGTPIGFIIRNKDNKSKEYDHLKDTFRPSHADYTYNIKYGIRNHQGGGRSSARETACRVIGGAIAKLILAHYNISITAWVNQVGDIALSKPYSQLDFSLIETNPVRCPDVAVATKMESYIKEIKKDGDTIGGVLSAVIKNCPPGLGEPVMDKFQAILAKAMLSINAVKGFEYGSGFGGVTMKGSEHNDLFIQKEKGIGTQTNYSGGIQGGISNGEDIYFNVAFKPVATIMKPQQSIDSSGKSVRVEGKGRHDPCVVPRAVPIVEAMAAMVVADLLLINRCSRLDEIS